MLPTQKGKEACKILGGLNVEEKRTVKGGMGVFGSLATCIGFALALL